MPRATSAQQIFDNMASAFVPEEAKGMNAVIQFDLTGEGGGNWYATIANGQLATGQGTAPNPTLTLSASAADYLAIINGDLKPMGAFMSGKVKIQGDFNLAMKLQKLFQAPE